MANFNIFAYNLEFVFRVIAFPSSIISLVKIHEDDSSDVIWTNWITIKNGEQLVILEQINGKLIEKNSEYFNNIFFLVNKINDLEKVMDDERCGKIPFLSYLQRNENDREIFSSNELLLEVLSKLF
jgi:hypothetical protein